MILKSGTLIHTNIYHEKVCELIAAVIHFSIRTASLETIKHVLLIGLDGVSPEGFQYASTPVMDDLISKGCLSLKTRAVLPTVSAPNWATILWGTGPGTTWSNLQ